MPRVLVVDDEAGIRQSLEVLLRRDGHEVVAVRTAGEAKERLSAEAFDAVFTDLRLPDASGLEVLRHAVERRPAPQVIVITGFATIETAVQAIKSGAYDYMTKPLAPDDVRAKLARALERAALTLEVEHLRLELTQCFGFQNLIGRSAAMQEVQKVIRQTARSESAVLISGESGTGKELVARAIHYNSPRRDARFVPINCGAISRDLIEAELFGYRRGAFTGAVRDRTGLVETASGGTLFLDEIGETTPDFQVKLLRVIQEGEFLRVGESLPTRVDLRVVAASNRDLPRAMAAGQFREDLYYRLNVISINLPPLRRRLEDVPLLALHFLEKYADKAGGVKPELDAGALDALLSYDYPGNVRELENAVEYALTFARGAVITAQDLPPAVRGGGRRPAAVALKPFRVAKQEFERNFVAAVLAQCGGNISAAARVLDLHRQSLQHKLKELDLRAEDFRSEEEGA